MEDKLAFTPEYAYVAVSKVGDSPTNLWCACNAKYLKLAFCEPAAIEGFTSFRQRQLLSGYFYLLVLPAGKT